MHLLNGAPVSKSFILLGVLGLFIALIKVWRQEPDTSSPPVTPLSPWRMYFVIAQVIFGISVVIVTIYFPQVARTILHALQ